MKRGMSLRLLTRYPNLEQGLFIVSIALMALSCSDASVVHPSWEPVTEVMVSEALGSPTGKIGSAPSTGLISLAEQRLPALIEVAGFIGHLATVVNEVAQADNSEVSKKLPEITTTDANAKEVTWGTSLFVKLACPGATALPPYDFSNGEVRLDSPTFSGLDFSPLFDDGQFLLSFDQCALGKLNLNAQFPGRYIVDLSRFGLTKKSDDPDYPLFGLALNFGEADPEGPVGLVGVLCGNSTSSCRDDVRAFAELKAGDAGTYVVSLRVTRDYWNARTELEVLIRGADSESSCILSASSPPRLQCATTKK